MPNGKPVTAVVRRRIREGAAPDFEKTMEEFMRFALAAPGHLGITVLRPSAPGSRDYTVVNQFADYAARRAFTSSDGYRGWMSRLRELTDGDPAIEELEGLSAWFPHPDNPHPARPAKWKMAIVTFTGVYPLTSTIPMFSMRLMPGLHPLVVNAVATAAIVALLNWAVMPALTRVFAGWLFKREK